MCCIFKSLNYLYVGAVVGQPDGAAIVANLRGVDMRNAVKVLEAGGQLVAVAHQVAERHAGPVLCALCLQRVSFHLR